MYQLTMADIKATTDQEFIRGTNRCLPSRLDVPHEFYWKDNVYNNVADHFYIGEVPTKLSVQFNPGFEDAQQDPSGMTKFIMAHIKTLDYAFEDKIAAIAYMLSIITTITKE